MQTYLKFAGATKPEERLPVQFFTERDICPKTWMERGWLTAVPIGETTPCRFCGDNIPVRLKNHVLTARCPICGSYALTEEERMLYAICTNPLTDALCTALNCKGETTPANDGISCLGRGAIAGQSRAVHFLRGVTTENLETVQKLLAASKRNLIFCCADFTDCKITSNLPENQFFPLNGLLRETDDTPLFDREEFLLRFQHTEVDKPKVPRISSEEEFYRKKVIHELTNHFFSVRTAYQSAQRTGVKFTTPRRPTQALIAKMVGSYPVMIHRIMEKHIGPRMLYENAEDLNYILNYLKNPIFGL